MTHVDQIHGDGMLECNLVPKIVLAQFHPLAAVFPMLQYFGKFFLESSETNEVDLKPHPKEEKVGLF